MARGKVHKLEERDLRFTFPGANGARHFDSEVKEHRGSMSAVDFIIDYPTFDLFVEVKDPDVPSATPERRAKFVAKLNSDVLITSLVRKYRDSWIYRWAEGHRDKPINYAVLLQLGTLDHAQMIGLVDRLGAELPKDRAPTWTQGFVSHVAFFNMTAWNRFGRYGQVQRISALGS